MLSDAGGGQLPLGGDHGTHRIGRGERGPGRVSLTSSTGRWPRCAAMASSRSPSRRGAGTAVVGRIPLPRTGRTPRCPSTEMSPFLTAAVATKRFPRASSRTTAELAAALAVTADGQSLKWTPSMSSLNNSSRSCPVGRTTWRLLQGVYEHRADLTFWLRFACEERLRRTTGADGAHRGRTWMRPVARVMTAASWLLSESSNQHGMRSGWRVLPWPPLQAVGGDRSGDTAPVLVRSAAAALQPARLSISDR